jgi:hypothetical protein
VYLKTSENILPIKPVIPDLAPLNLHLFTALTCQRKNHCDVTRSKLSAAGTNGTPNFNKYLTSGISEGLSWSIYGETKSVHYSLFQTLRQSKNRSIYRLNARHKYKTAGKMWNYR